MPRVYHTVTHCKRGHLRSAENNIGGQAAFDRGRWACAICRRERRRDQARLAGKIAPQAKTHCPKGHPLVEGNLKANKRGRQCLTCHRKREWFRANPNASTYTPRREPHNKRAAPGLCANGHPWIPENLRIHNGESECRICHAESSKRRYHQDPVRFRAEASAYQKAHWSERLDYARRWRARNIADVRAYNRRRQKLKRAGAFDPETVEWIDVTIADDLCSYCSGPANAIDHIIPVSKGGQGFWNNLVKVCSRCNSKKKNRDLLKFLLAVAQEADSAV